MRERARVLNELISSIHSDFRTKFENESVYADLFLAFKKLENRSAEYTNPSFVILVVGPVKSGKSTFVNLVAKEYVSPTNFLECTIRPSLISATEGRKEITMYRSNNQQQMGDQMESILDCINGLIDTGEVPDVTTETIKLTPENSKDIIDKYVALQLSAVKKDNIILTSIKTTGGSLLQDKVYLVDMPGFDGANANLDSDTYKKIAERADLIVFIQSSNSAISKVATAFFDLIKNNNNSAPVCLVHNVFDAAHWREDEVIQRTVEEQKNYAVDMIGSTYKLRIEQQNAYNINLGKVYDLMNNNYRKDEYEALTREKCYFEEVEQKMHDLIVSGRESIRIRNCINRTMIQHDSLIKLFDEHILRLNALVEKYNDVAEVFEELKRTEAQINVVMPITITLNKLLGVAKDEYYRADHDVITDSYTTEKARALVNQFLDAVKGHLNNCLRENIAELKKGEFEKTLLDWRSDIIAKAVANGNNVSINIGVNLPEKEIVFNHGIDVNDLVRVKPLWFCHSQLEVKEYLRFAYEKLTEIPSDAAQISGYIGTNVYPDMLEKIENAKSLYIKDIISEGNQIIDTLTKETQTAICFNIKDVKSKIENLQLFKNNLSSLINIVNL